jgi:hypothetical protein
MKNSRDLNDLEEQLKDAFVAAKKEWELENPGYIVRPSSTYRDPEYQFSLYKSGRTQQEDGSWKLTNPKKWLTDKDGHKNKSKHNLYPSQAVDVFFVKKSDPSVADWSSELFQSFSVKMLSRAGIKWGGHWKRKDRPHFEI